MRDGNTVPPAVWRIQPAASDDINEKQADWSIVSGINACIGQSRGKSQYCIHTRSHILLFVLEAYISHVELHAFVRACDSLVDIRQCDCKEQTGPQNLEQVSSLQKVQHLSYCKQETLSFKSNWQGCIWDSIKNCGSECLVILFAFLFTLKLE